MFLHVSVVMPLYNKEREVGRALRSVLAQTYQDFELIVVDDGSTDSSVEQVMANWDARIRLIRQSNHGVSAARNRGMLEARYALISFIDADDEWLPGFLAKIIELRNMHSQAKVYATSYLRRSTDGSQSKAVLRAERSDFQEGILENYFSVAARSDPPVCSSAVAVDREALKEIGGFPEGVRCGEDLLTWARLASRWPVAYTRQALAVFWMHAGVSERLDRFDVKGDPVGVGLGKLYDETASSTRKGIREYLATWYRMRAVIALQLNRRKECIWGVCRSIQFGGLEPRIALVGFLALLPYPNPAKLFIALKKFKTTQSQFANDKSS